MKRLLLSILAFPLVIVYVLIYKTRWVMAGICLLLAVYASYRLTYDAGCREGIRQQREAIAGKISAIKVDQEKGFQEKARQGILNLQHGRD